MNGSRVVGKQRQVKQSICPDIALFVPGDTCMHGQAKLLSRQHAFRPGKQSVHLF